MDWMRMECREGNTVLQGVKHFCLEEILECGQSFRWNKIGEEAYEGVAFGRYCQVTQAGDRLIFHEIDQEEFETVWWDYFDLGRDYGALKERFAADPVMVEAMAFCPGMRVLRQEPWEALCSFILSQNNNIKRIRGLVERLCGLLGEPLEAGDGRWNAFPMPEALAACSLEDLAPVRSGFRGKYLLDAARKVVSGEIVLEELYTAPIDEARSCLRQIAGVGPKVAECALLYGWNRIECFPVDVWIRRALEAHYPQGFPKELEPWAGIAQQYLFHYMRCAPRPQAAAAN